MDTGSRKPRGSSEEDMHLAQFNISFEKAPLDNPAMKDFIDGLAPVNHSADNSKGFVWRLHDDTGNATAMRVFDDKRIIFNLSVWESIDLLKQFVYQSRHMDVLKRRGEWFERHTQPSYVLWWIPKGHLPSVDEAKARLVHLQKHGPTPFAFTFQQAFEPASADPITQ
jgi:hypothetical protein